jgi:hypothetical protein
MNEKMMGSGSISITEIRFAFTKRQEVIGYVMLE